MEITPTTLGGTQDNPVSDYDTIVLEVGFGSGEHLVGQAIRAPNTLFLGAEPFKDGMAAILGDIEAQDINNIRLYAGDVRNLLEAMPDSLLAAVYILFPDPWPKKRHNKRRLVNTPFLDSVCRASQNGARIRFATDVMDYADTAMINLYNHPNLSWMAQDPDDWRLPPKDHITTRYESKRLGDIVPVFYDFKVSKAG